MSMKASEIGAWLRQVSGRRDHREALRDDYHVLRPGPNFEWFMSGLAAGQSTPATPKPSPVGDDHREDANRTQQFSP